MPTRRKHSKVRAPLTNLAGLLTESGKVYREMRAGKIRHDEGRSLVWVLGQMRAIVEAQALERIEARLDELAAEADSPGVRRIGHENSTRQVIQVN